MSSGHGVQCFVDIRTLLQVMLTPPEGGFIYLPPSAQWTQEGVTVAGGNGEGDNANQLNCLLGFCLIHDDDDNQQQQKTMVTIIIADFWNHRVVQWKTDDTSKNGQVITTDEDEGNKLARSTDMLYDKETDSFLIADSGNQRVLRNLYVTDIAKHEVRRYQLRGGIVEDKTGILVAGGNGEGVNLTQLAYPNCIFVDRQQNVYMSDSENDRIMK
ncbi:unnamed protein product [Rotaria sp. Silwood2]|nr:unnamed protein product [Rotaria sp. Silwood2]